jgi:PKD repeat protein
MKRNPYLGRSIAAILYFICGTAAMYGQTMTELAVPRYFGSKSTASANNIRTPFGVCLRIDGLLPFTTYDIKGGLALVSDPASAYGAGNIWDGNSFSASRLVNAFTTDATGSSGPFWVFFQPTGNAARFDAGQSHNLRIGYTVTGGTMPGSPSFIGTKGMTALDIAVTQRTASGTDDGAFIKGSAMPSATGKYVLLYDNVAGTGDPLFIYQVRQAIPVQPSQQDLPTSVNDIYMQAGTSAAGDYPAVVPTGSNNPGGVRRVESRNADFSIYAFNTDDDGIWPAGGNTTVTVRREVVTITSADAPLVPGGPVLPTVWTDTLVTGITSDSATSGGDVTADGGDTITSRGLCWSTVPAPTDSGNYVTVPGTTGPFTATMSGLLPDTTYYFRAFAANSTGTAYGSERSFMTLCELSVPASGFWADDTVIFTGDTVNFFDATLYCPESWNWSFVGGIPMSSTVPNPTGIVFNFPGAFNICLTTSNIHGTHTFCRHGYISVSEPVIPKLVITEIMYNPPESGTDSLEFIELYNNDSVPVNLLDCYFSAGVTYTFPDQDLAPGERIVVCKNDSALYRTFGISALKWTSGSLTNSGELIQLMDAFDHTVDSVAYDESAPWDPLCNGGGPSLELCDPDSDNALGENWRHALEFAAVNTAGDTIWASPMEGCLYPPSAAFEASDTVAVKGDSVLFTNLSAGSPLTFEWTFEGGIPGSFAGESPPPVFYPNSGLFDVSLRVSNAIGEDILLKPAYIEVSNYTGTDDREVSFSLYPNPAQDGTFRIRFPSAAHYEVTILNMTGQTVLVREISGTCAITGFSDIPKGLFIVLVRKMENGITGARKIVIQ